MLFLILDWLGIELPESSETLTNYAFGVFTLSLVALLTFMNVLGYFLSLHLVQRYDISNKYPKFRRIVNFYEKNSLLFILIETLFCIGCLLFLIITAFIYLKKIIF
jgi:uncharacterized protein Usg